jgi:ABC-2 type transport system ATP-binding protein
MITVLQAPGVSTALFRNRARPTGTRSIRVIHFALAKAPVCSQIPCHDMSLAPVIATEGLCKIFGRQRALDNVTLQVSPGAIGLLGPNGAGKSTFMKCLLQLLPITSGSARLLGREVGREGREIRKRVGYAPEQNCHIPGMAGCEYVAYCAQLSGLPFQAARQRAHEMLDFVGLGQERYRAVDTYSLGLKQRIKLAQAIVHDPELVFLDEPTNGLDPKGQVQILELIRGLWRAYGITVVLSSHLLNDVERVCEQIIIIARGRVLVHDTLENLKARKRGAAEVVLAGGHGELQAACERRNWLCQILPNGHLRIEHQADSLNPLLNVLHELKLPPLEIIPSPNALEETFVQALEISHAAA